MDELTRENEAHVLDQLKFVLGEFDQTFRDLNIVLENTGIKYSGINEKYFSEIELYFWKNNTIIDALSILIYLNNQLVLDIQTFKQWLIDELKDICRKSQNI